jgi:hypothetical protein
VLDLCLLDVLLEEGHLFLKLGQQAGVLIDQLEIGFQFLDREAQLRVDQQEAVQDLLFLLQAGRFLGLAPDGGIGQLGVDLLDPSGLLGYFKETPEGRRLSASIRRTGFLVERVPWPDCSGFHPGRQGLGSGKNREERGKNEGRESERSQNRLLSHFVFPLPFPRSSLCFP